MTELLLLGTSLLLMLACGVFVAAEFSFVTVDRGTVDRAVESGDRGARGVQSALRSLSQGRASFAMTFERYAPMPPRLALEAVG